MFFDIDYQYLAYDLQFDASVFEPAAHAGQSALDPNYDGSNPIDLDEWLNPDPLEQIEPWLQEAMEDLNELLLNDPNVGHIVQSLLAVENPSDQVVNAAANVIEMGVAQSAAGGYYDDWVFQTTVDYIHFNTDWDQFFDEYSSIF